LKHCNVCDTSKERDQFHRRAASKDGLAARCKQCQKTYDDARANEPHRVAARLAYSNTDRGRERSHAAKEAYIKREPKKRKAHNAVNNALRDGKMTKKPCEVCGSSYKPHAHHDDYDKVYDVRWLCNEHHREWHRINGEAKNPY